MPSRACRSSAPAPAPCSTPSPPGRGWSSRRPAPSRWPPTATPPPCCSTRGRCSSARASPRGRRPCAGGWPRRPWCGRHPRAAGSCSPGPRPRCRSRPSRRSCAGTPPGSPSASSTSGVSCRCRRPSRLAVLTGARPALEAATAELDLPRHGTPARPAAARRHRPLAHPGHRAAARRPGAGPRARGDARPGVGPQGPRPGVGARRPPRPHDVTAPHLRHLDSAA